MTKQSDGSIPARRNGPRRPMFTRSWRTRNLTGITGFRLETLADPSLPRSRTWPIGKGKFRAERIDRAPGAAGRSSPAGRRSRCKKPVRRFPRKTVTPSTGPSTAILRPVGAVFPKFGAPHTLVLETKENPRRGRWHNFKHSRSIRLLACSNTIGKLRIFGDHLAPPR